MSIEDEETHYIRMEDKEVIGGGHQYTTTIISISDLTESELDANAASDDSNKNSKTEESKDEVQHSVRFDDEGPETHLLKPAVRQEAATKRNRRHPPQLQKLKSHLDLFELGKNEKELKANLFFHIGNPVKRWKIERVIPVKLLLQLVKTFCLIVQVVLFSQTIPYQRAVFFYNSREVFEQHFLPNTSSRDGPRAMYTAFSVNEVLDIFNHICSNYYKLPNITIGGYDFQHTDHGTPTPVKMELTQYNVVSINATNFTYTLKGDYKTIEFNVNENESASEKYIDSSDDQLFNKFKDMTISFPIHNVRVVHRSRAECFSFSVTIRFESTFDSGKIDYYLREAHHEQKCTSTVIDTSSLAVLTGVLTFLDILLIILSLISIFLIFATIRRAVILGKAMGMFYQDQLQISLSWWERRSLFSGWHLLNFFSDIIIIVGSAYKIALNLNVVVLASPTRVFLGTAILLQAGVMLRYVSYFKELNALNRTLYLALPELLKFLLCAGLLFLAFALTGWIVLGSFHPKFVTFYESVETLFCLLNGDDVYTTFDLIDVDDDWVAYLFSRVFLYVFLVLFIYFVLNLFTSLVITAYEASQHVDNSTKNEVRKFVFSGPLTPNGVALRDVTLTKKYVDPQEILKRGARKQEEAKVKRRAFSFVDGLNAAA